MKKLYETILDADEIIDRTDSDLKRQYELPNILNKTYKYSDMEWAVEDDEIYMDCSKTGWVCNHSFNFDSKLFDIAKEYKIKTISFHGRVSIEDSKNISIKNIDMGGCATLHFSAPNISMSRCSIKTSMSLSFRCKSLNLAACQIDCGQKLGIYGSMFNATNFRGSKIKTRIFLVTSNDQKYVDLLPEIGVKASSWCLDWVPGDKYTNIDPLEVLGFDAKSLNDITRFILDLEMPTIMGVKQKTGKFVFALARQGDHFRERNLYTDYKMGQYFKNWSQFKLLDHIP